MIVLESKMPEEFAIPRDLCYLSVVRRPVLFNALRHRLPDFVNASLTEGFVPW